MKDTLEILKQFAEDVQDAWLINKIKLLEAQIELEVIKAETAMFNHLREI